MSRSTVHEVSPRPQISLFSKGEVVKTVLLKLDESVHTIWVSAAKREKVSLSEWIRTQCNAKIGPSKVVIDSVKDSATGETLTRVRRNEPSDAHDAGRTGGVAPRERRARVATGGTHKVSVAFVNSAGGIVTPATSSSV